MRGSYIFLNVLHWIVNSRQIKKGRDLYALDIQAYIGSSIILASSHHCKMVEDLDRRENGIVAEYMDGLNSENVEIPEN